MRVLSLLGIAATLSAPVRALPQPAGLSVRADTGLALPLKTSGRDIVDANGDTVVYQGTNWPGHMNAMVPEGLQYSSVKDIVAKIKGFGLNAVRLTFPIELVDQIYDKGHDTSIADSFKAALGEETGAEVVKQILAKNPQFTEQTTRLEVFDDVAQELAKEDIYLHLDNHVSKAFWCCGTGDGNGFFGEKYFNVTQWIRGWKYMAAHADEHFPSWSSVGLRNELRSATHSSDTEPYDWYTWYQHMTAAADAVHSATSKPLIFFSGLNFDTYIQAIPLNQTLKGTAGTSTEGKTAHFDPSAFPYHDKIVLEVHRYDHGQSQEDCSSWVPGLYSQGFQALNASDPDTKYVFPVLMTEWGFAQDGKYYKQTTYNKCMIEFVKKYKIGWLQWVLAGSYYIKTTDSSTAVIDSDEGWGLLNHDWSGTRSQVTVDNSITKMIEAGSS